MRRCALFSYMDTERATILLVEDHRSTRRFLADNLTADGFELLEADSLRAAERLLRRERPDLVLLDLGLPDGEGLELAREVRGECRLAGRIDPDVPLLILSGRDGELERLRGFESGCDDYVVKPFSYPELLGFQSGSFNQVPAPKTPIPRQLVQPVQPAQPSDRHVKPFPGLEKSENLRPGGFARPKPRREAPLGSASDRVEQGSRPRPAEKAAGLGGLSR